MVTFKDGSFSITVKVPSNPIEGWLRLHEELTFLLSTCMDPESCEYNPYMTLELITEMMPDMDLAKKMIGG